MHRTLTDLARTLIWTLPMVMITASLFPAGLEIRPGWNTQIEHLLFYGLMAFAFTFIHPRRTIAILTVFIGSALLLETLQNFASGRTPSLLDFAASALGTQIGLAVALATIALLRRS